jgi:hypothetical protein
MSFVETFFAYDLVHLSFRVWVRFLIHWHPQFQDKICRYSSFIFFLFSLVVFPFVSALCTCVMPIWCFLINLFYEKKNGKLTSNNPNSPNAKMLFFLILIQISLAWITVNIKSLLMSTMFCRNNSMRYVKLLFLSLNTNYYKKV